MSGIKSPRCARGHKMSGANLYIRLDGRGRQCRKCKEMFDRKRARKKKAVRLSTESTE